MKIGFEDLPGHEGDVALRLADGSLRLPGQDADRPGHQGEPSPDEADREASGYRAICSCGWNGSADHPLSQPGLTAASLDWSQHVKPLLAVAPPVWLLSRSHAVRDAVTELSSSWPLQALAVLVDIERWQRALSEQAVAQARAAGHSWAEIGAALGVTKQSAHERFKAVGRTEAGVKA